MDEIDLMKARRAREALRAIQREQEARRQRLLADCLDRWYWGEMGQTPDPLTARRTAA